MKEATRERCLSARWIAMVFFLPLEAWIQRFLVTWDTGRGGREDPVGEEAGRGWGLPWTVG